MKEFLRDNDVSKADLRKKVKESLHGKTKEELQEIIKSGKIEKLPAFIAILISAYVKNYDMGIDTFLDHVFGDNKAANDKK
jgi:hypothetical protein